MCVLTPPFYRLYSNHRSVCYVRQITILSSDKDFDLVDFYATSAVKDCDENRRRKEVEDGGTLSRACEV